MNTDEIFPHPHEDESVEDSFTGPIDDYVDQSVGGTPIDPIAAATGSRRRLAMFGILAGVAVFLLFFLFSRGDNDAATTSAPGSGRLDSIVVAAPATVSQPQEDPITTPPVSSSYSSPSSSDANFIDPGMFDTPQGTAPYSTSPTAPTIPGSQIPYPYSPTTASPYGPSYGSVPGVTPGATQVPGAYSSEEIERQTMLDLQREEEERRRAELEAALNAQRAEEERLRSQSMIVISNESVINNYNVVAPGTSRFRDPGETALSTLPSLPTASATEAEPITSSNAFDALIVPGTRVHAVLVSEYISDMQSAGRIEARLTEPLRGRSGVILPAGTRAFGTASAGAINPGQAPRVEIQFDIYITPDGQTIRGLSGLAADPTTLAMSIPGKADHRTGQRIWRALLSTGVDLALTANAQDRRTAFEMPSPRDEAYNDIRRRAATIIGDPIGDESAFRPAVRLERGTRFMIIFGL